MYRRGRPLLGTAVVIGASRAAARREVQRSTAAQAQYETQVQQEAENLKRQEAEQDARVQRAVEEALNKAQAEQAPAPSPSPSPSASQVQAAQVLTGMQGAELQSSPPPTVQVDGSGMGSGSYPGPRPAGPGMPPPVSGGVGLAGMQTQGLVTPRSFLRTPSPGGGSVSGPGRGGLKLEYCVTCGEMCDVEDVFCRSCGSRRKRPE